ncbi:M23 family metallopeptidase [Flavobacterium sp. CAU 1735]|uniref:M23 family metallopeptidase n=1 Tax=Flavobacterium sp. CAU 1735 TaxID=3140361 RepID=UPI0032602AB0
MRLLLFFCFSFLCCFSQNQYPKDYFRSPLDIPLQSSGTFGELRGNHFHSGLDYKTQQRTGLPVFAVADGYVSRIKVSTFGYGHALYITHPNGVTTVYGHLKAYSGKIGEYVRKKQYAQKKFEVEIFPLASELPVTKSELIALSGNTGGSGGPHLHFEYRDTKTEKTLNPLLFGMDKETTDTKAPSINGIAVYPISDDAVVNQSQNPVLVALSLQKDGSYMGSKVMAKGAIGFSLDAYDTSDNNYSKNGIYKVETFLNGTKLYGYQFDAFSFDESRYINNFIDFERYKKTKLRYQKLFYKKSYPFSIISSNAKNGQIAVKEKDTFSYRIEVSDFHNNKTIINIPVVYSDQPVKFPRKEVTTPYFIKASNDHNFTKDNISVFVPANAFYEDFYLRFDVKNNILDLHDDTVPAHNNITITFDVKGIPNLDYKRSFIGRMDGSKPEYFTTTKKGDLFSIRTKDLGKFMLMQDSVGPRIYKPNFATGSTIDKLDTISVHIQDDLSGIKEYNGYLNGKWILMKYDYKTKLLVHDLNDMIYDDGRNDLKIIVSDNIGNSTTFETHFFKTLKPTSLEKNN